ncbi:hypothetical protein AAY473_011546 [Plecturocebus cupreus]
MLYLHLTEAHLYPVNHIGLIQQSYSSVTKGRGRYSGPSFSLFLPASIPPFCRVLPSCQAVVW